VTAAVPCGRAVSWLAALAMALGVLAMPSAAMAFAYVANSGSNTVSVIDTTTTPPSVVATVAVGGNPAGIAVTRDGTRAYVAIQNSNNVTVLDITTTSVGHRHDPSGGCTSGDSRRAGRKSRPCRE
jgi:YVTN family beta-propeller protein